MKLKQNTMDDEEQIKYNPKESSLEARSVKIYIINYN